MGMEGLSATERAFTSLQSVQKNVDKNAKRATEIHIGPLSFPDFGLFRSENDKQALQYAQNFNEIMNNILKKIGDIELLALREPGR